MAIEHLDTKKMTEVVNGFKSAADLFKEERQRIERATTNLLNSWVGKGRNTFESQFKIISKQIKDMEKELYDLYGAIVEAECIYYDTDDKLGKEIKAASEK